MFFYVPKRFADAQDVRFVLNLGLSLELASDSGEGVEIFTVFTSGWAGVQVTVRSFHNKKGELRREWSTVDLFGGSRSVRFPSRQVEIDVRNFTPLRGVKPGLNRFSIHAERFGDIKFARALVGGASGIEMTHARPPELKIDLEPLETPAVRGEPFEVEFKLRNTGTVPARGVSARLESFSPKLLVVEGQDTFSFERLQDEKEISFRVRGKRAGTYKLALDVVSANANKPLMRIAAPIGSKESQGSTFPWDLIVMSAIVVSLGGWGILRRRHKRKH